MDQYCVVVCGLQAGVAGDDATWQPVAAALKLDRADFARRVVAALPRIVRRDLERTTAERIAQLLQAMHVDARALPDDPQLASIERAGSIRGPLPQSSLGDFIQPGESYRLHGSTAWLSWPAPVEQQAMATATPTAAAGNSGDATAPPVTSNGPVAAMPPPHTTSDVDDMIADMRPAGIDDEPPYAMPPPLPTPPTRQPPSTPEAAVDPTATEPGMDVDQPLHDDESFDQTQDTPGPPDLDATDPLAPAAAETVAPIRSRAGRVVVLLLLAGLACWAYAHWIADTRGGQAPAMPPAANRPAQGASGQPATPAPTASVMQAATAPAPAMSTAASPAATSATPPGATSGPAAPGTDAAATVSTAASSAPRAGSTIAPAQPAPAATTATARPTH